MTHDDVQAWLDRYVAAWETYDPDAIGLLFNEDAEYRYHPWEEPIRGRAAIVSSWVAPEGDASSRDAPGSWTATYRPYAVVGDRAVATGQSDYVATGQAPARTYHNCFVLEFDSDGRCRSFSEYFMKEPAAG